MRYEKPQKDLSPRAFFLKISNFQDTHENMAELRENRFFFAYW